MINQVLAFKVIDSQKGTTQTQGYNVLNLSEIICNSHGPGIE